MGGIRSLLLGSLAAAMLATSIFMPPAGGSSRPTFERREGLGRRKKLKNIPRDSLARRRTGAWREYAAKVVATHSNRPDPRDDKYLHAHARMRRTQALSAAGRA
jgi:hypothetical protein